MDMCDKKTLCLLLAGFFGITALLKGMMALLGITTVIESTQAMNALAFVVDGILAVLFFSCAQPKAKTRPKRKR